jgi:MarR family transcriptional regulator, lower aerobic nicotinate degradation pathway regulator
VPRTNAREKRVPTSELDLVDGLFQLSFLLQNRLARIAAAHELSLIQVRLLGILRDREPGMLELARHLELEKSSLSGLIDRAEARGLVERVPSADDRRAATVRMTALGRKLSRVVAEKVSADVGVLLAALPERDRARLTSLVERIVLQPGQLRRASTS